MSAAFDLSTFKHELDNKPARMAATWAEFVVMLSAPQISACTLDTCGTGPHAYYDDRDGRYKGCRCKYGVGAWSPASYAKGKTRVGKNVIGVSMLVADLDHMDGETFEAALASLQRYRYVAHGTHSDRPDDRCARVAIATSRAVTENEWPRFWPAAMRALGQPADQQCSDSNRIYFKPSRPSDGVYFFVEQDGDVLDVDAILATAPAIKSTPPKPKPSKRANAGGTLFDVLQGMDQGAVLTEISGTPLVNGQQIEIGRPNRNGNRAIIIDGKATAGFIDSDGKIGHKSTGSSAAGVDGGPYAFSWCRHYGHSNKDLYGLFIEHVGALSGFKNDPPPSYYDHEEPARATSSDAEATADTGAPEIEPFARDEHGKIYKSQKNIIIALRRLGVTVRYDEFSSHELIDGLAGHGPRIDPAAMNRLRMAIDAEFQLLPTKELFHDVVSDQARLNHFHPVREYLAGLEWDQVERIDRFLSVYGGAVDSYYTRAVSRLFFVAAVRRIRQPGCKFDEMPILESEQGTDKSSALAALAGPKEWFADDLPLGADTQRLMEATLGKWIVEAGELKGMSKGDVATLKSYVSRQVDEVRLPYDHKPTIAPRQFVIIGTTNETEGYLKDNTGNRRFWPVRVERFDAARVRKDRDQLWAEAAHHEGTGESIRLDPALYAAAAEQQNARRTEDPFTAVLADALGDLTGKLRQVDAYRIIDSSGALSVADGTRVTACLRDLGWEKTQLRFGPLSTKPGDPENGFARGTKEERATLLDLDIVTNPYRVKVRRKL